MVKGRKIRPIRGTIKVSNAMATLEVKSHIKTTASLGPKRSSVATIHPHPISVLYRIIVVKQLVGANNKTYHKNTLWYVCLS